MSHLRVRRLNPATLPPPPGYSQVVAAQGGTLIVISGQVALDTSGNVIGVGDVETQAVQVFLNIVAALEAAGAEPRHVIKLTTFLTDMSAGLPAFRAARDRFLDLAHPPASTLVQVDRLFRPEFLIEIEALAVL